MKVIKQTFPNFNLPLYIDNPGPYVVINTHDTTRSEEELSDLPPSGKQPRTKESSGNNANKRAGPITSRFNSNSSEIDAQKARFPFCIVWTPLPLITWLLPFIGHTGIAMSDGVIHDFAGPYTISVDDLAFGETHK